MGIKARGMEEQSAMGYASYNPGESSFEVGVRLLEECAGLLYWRMRNELVTSLLAASKSFWQPGVLGEAFKEE